MFRFSLIAAAIVSGVVWWSPARAEEGDAAYPIAILKFAERGSGAQGMGQQVADLLFASLVADPDILLVDRQDLDKTISEAELNVSGAVNPAEATQLGQLTGAKVLLTGSVVQVDRTLVLVVKIIGSEMARPPGRQCAGRPATNWRRWSKSSPKRRQKPSRRSPAT